MTETVAIAATACSPEHWLQVGLKCETDGGHMPEAARPRVRTSAKQEGHEFESLCQQNPLKFSTHLLSSTIVLLFTWQVLKSNLLCANMA